MTQPEAVRVLGAFIEDLVALGDGKRAVALAEKLTQTAPDDAGALGVAAEVLFEHGDPKRSFDLHWDYLHRARATMDPAGVARVLYRLGESARRAGDLSAAKEPLEESATLDPSQNAPLKALAELHGARGDWESVLRTMYRQLDNLTGDDRVSLLLEIGDLAARKLKEPEYAAKSYLAALNEKPSDRKILTKLMQLYSEEKDWDRLVRVILKLADFVDDHKQKSKYMHTAGRIAFREMKEPRRASQILQRALELDPHNHDLIDEALEVHNKAQNAEALKELLKRRIKVASDRNDKGMLLGSLTALADLYLKHFRRLEQAIAVYEGAQEVEHSVERQEMLAELYASDPDRYLDRAIAAHADILQRDPFRPEAHRTLRKLYTDAKRPDPAWCCCQALYVLGQAEPDEERFYLRMRGDDGAQAKDRLREADFHALVMHPDADPLLSGLLSLIEPAVIATRGKSLSQLGFREEHLVDPTHHHFAIAQTLPYVADVLGQASPPMLQHPNDFGELGFVPSQPPTILLGTSVVGVALLPQTALFMSARHLTYYRTGLYIRQLVPTTAALKAWLFAAIAMAVPAFPIPQDMTASVQEAHRALERHVSGPARDHLAAFVSKLLGSGTALDLKKWTRAVDLSADRAGFIMADDLQTAIELIRASDPRSSVASAEERVEQLYQYAVSEPYFEIRRKLRIAIDS
jgi:tetratricopeptide (TPR) repeat protein